MMAAKKSFKKYIFFFWLFIIGAYGGAYLLFYTISLGIFGKLPTFEELENPNSSLATEVFTADNKVIGKYYSQNRSNVSFENLPDNLVNCLIATEDARYNSHAGIDFIALGRVLKGLITFNSQGGGSTVTQQLAKNLFPRERLGKIGLVLRKLKEWVIATRLEKSYTKEEIMTMYLNTVEFSDNAFGIKSAARTYFNKLPDSLKTEESAVLVGMLKAPYRFNPRIHPDNSTGRRNVVISQMQRYGYINKEVKDSLQNLPLEIDFTRTSHDEGLAPYFREFLRMELKNWCAKNLKPDGSEYNIYKDGLKIYTSIDSRMQHYAEEAVEEHLSELQTTFFEHWKGKDPWKDFKGEFEREYKNNDMYRAYAKEGLSNDSIDVLMNTPIQMKVFSWQGEIDTSLSPVEALRYHRMFLQTGMMAMDPESGYVRAWVGGINYKYFQYDHVNINTKRQIGSTFKPFVYAVAVSNGHSPCLTVPNELVTFEKDNPRWTLLKDWTPKNSNSKYGGIMTIKDGLANSVNTITAYLMHESGPAPVISLATNMGIGNSLIENYPSICLGTPDISVYEMVTAYGTFANIGVRTEPLIITRIEDKNGNVLASFQPIKKEEALDEEVAYIMIEMLKNVINRGSGQRLRFRYKIDIKNIAGKTGTTQNHSDGWFMGFSPELVAGVWVGCEDRFVRFRSMRYGQGASMALPIWGKFYQKAYADSTLGFDKTKSFQKPRKKLTIELDCSKYEKQKTQEFDRGYGDEFDEG